MKHFKEDFIEIYHHERGLLLLMVLNLLIAIVFCVFAIVHIDPSSAVIKIGYGDIGGYRDGTWGGLLAFPLLALILGVLHGLLALKIFHKRGSGMAKFFLMTTTALILGTFLVFIRLIGES